jgi:predicted nucleic acid-binding protein
MALTTEWLIDKSAFVRLARSLDGDLWLQRINRGLVRVSTFTLLELGYSARSGEQWHTEMSRPPIASMPVVNLVPRMEARALEVQELLVDRGQHVAPGVIDLFIAATAELAGLTVLHVDRDFELIAEVTGQPVERLSGDF